MNLTIRFIFLATLLARILSAAIIEVPADTSLLIPRQTTDGP